MVVTVALCNEKASLSRCFYVVMCGNAVFGCLVNGRFIVLLFCGYILGAKIDIKKGKDYFISYRPSDIYLHDLNKYLTLTNVKENNNFYSIEISPNPSNNRKFSLNITTDTIFNADINLYNINGQLEFNIIKNRIFTNGENVLEFSIPNELSSGQYYLKIESEGGSQDVKIQF